MTMSKLKKILFSFVMLSLLLTLLMVNRTGVIYHCHIGVVFILIILFHILIRKGEIKLCTPKMKTVHRIMFLLLIIMVFTAITSFLIGKILFLIVLHKLSACLFMVSVIVHVIQHKERIRKYVS